VQVVDCSGCLCVGDYGGGVLDSVNVNGLLCGGPLKSGGIGGGLFGGGVGDSLRCGGVNAELLRLQLRIDASVGGGGGGLFGGGVGDSLCSDGASAELRNVLLLLADARPKYSSHTEPFLIVFFRDVGALVCFAGTCARGKESRKIIRVLRILLTPPLLPNRLTPSVGVFFPICLPHRLHLHSVGFSDFS
jgi:hypothetical protein